MAEEGTPLRKLQLAEYDLMCRMADVCQAQDIRYYLLGGTLLGAVRHGGFIPWDDDIDVALPRPDYERFLAYVAEHPESLRREGESCTIDVLSIYTKDDYRQGMAKITTDAVHIVNRSADADRYEEAWIDLIPLDGFPTGRGASFLHKLRLTWWKLMDAITEFDYVVDTKRDRGTVGNLALKLLRGLSRVCRPYGDDFNKVLRKWDEALKRYHYEECERALNLFAARGFSEIFRKDDLGRGTPLRFEGRDFMAPDNTPAVLMQIYGPDYLTPPPESDRNWHNSEVIE